MSKGTIDTVNGTCSCFTGTAQMIHGQCTCSNNVIGNSGSIINTLNNPPIATHQPPVIPPTIANHPVVANAISWYQANKTTALVIGAVAGYFLFFKKQ